MKSLVERKRSRVGTGVPKLASSDLSTLSSGNDSHVPFTTLLLVKASFPPGLSVSLSLFSFEPAKLPTAHLPIWRLCSLHPPALHLPLSLANFFPPHILLHPRERGGAQACRATWRSCRLQQQQLQSCCS